jgi:hypothetical protein
MSNKRFNAFCKILKESKFDFNLDETQEIFQRGITKIYETVGEKKLSGWQRFVKETVPTLKSLTNEDGKPLSSQGKMKHVSVMWKELSPEEKAQKWGSMTPPVATPVEAPVATPVEAPVATPVEAPVATPVEAPVATPVEAPVATPVDKNLTIKRNIRRNKKQ